MRKTTFIDNMGLYGGAISGGRDSSLVVQESSFSYNSAVYAGAVECVDCGSVEISR